MLLCTLYTLARTPSHEFSKKCFTAESTFQSYERRYWIALDSDAPVYSLNCAIFLRSRFWAGKVESAVFTDASYGAGSAALRTSLEAWGRAVALAVARLFASCSGTPLLPPNISLKNWSRRSFSPRCFSHSEKSLIAYSSSSKSYRNASELDKESLVPLFKPSNGPPAPCAPFPVKLTTSL